MKFILKFLKEKDKFYVKKVKYSRIGQKIQAPKKENRRK
jgi:hypothetical protein